MQASVISARRQSLEGLLAMVYHGAGLDGESVWLEPSLCMENISRSENFGYYVLTLW